MDSGCILGKCIYCGELVWGDEEWDAKNMKIFHTKCKSNSINPLLKYTNAELLNELIRRDKDTI